MSTIAALQSTLKILFRSQEPACDVLPCIAFVQELLKQQEKANGSQEAQGVPAGRLAESASEAGSQA